MSDISYPVLRTEKTDIAGSVTVTPSGGSTGTPIVAADLVNGFTPITVSFAAGETSKPAIFAVADDALVEGPETYRLTMSNPLPSGTFPSGAFVEGSIGDNDSGGGGGGDTIVYGPTTTTDTTFVQTGAATHRISGKLADVAVFTLWIGSNATGTDGVRWEYQGFNTWRLILVTGGADDVIQTGSVNPSGNPDFTFEQSGGRLKMVAGGATVFDRPDAGKTGTYARAQISSPGQPITITRLAS